MNSEGRLSFGGFPPQARGRFSGSPQTFENFPRPRVHTSAPSGAATATDLSDLFASFGGGGTGGGGGGTGGASVSVHTTLGLPSPTSADDPNSFLSVKADYVV